MKETEQRLHMVKTGVCKPAPGAQPAAWESYWLTQFGHTMQLSCNPAKYFVQANDQCPLAFRANFPCDPARKDYKFCTSDGAYGTLVPTLADKVSPK
jgi:hypothetical protein